MKCPRCGKDNPPSVHTCTPLALKLAAQADQLSLGEIAAELRRLHEAHEWQYTMAGERLRRIEKLEAAVSKLHKSKGRYHTQLAACDLFELCGLTAERPKK
jgi:hypothetical protein